MSQTTANIILCIENLFFFVIQWTTLDQELHTWVATPCSWIKIIWSDEIKGIIVCPCVCVWFIVHVYWVKQWQVIFKFIICLFTSYFKTLIYTNIILCYSWIILRLGCLRLTSSRIKTWYKVEVLYWKMCSGGRNEKWGSEEEGKSQFKMSPWTGCSNWLFHHIRPLEELYEVNFRTVCRV